MIGLFPLLVSVLWEQDMLVTASRALDFSGAADSGNYSCLQLKRWIKIEKHYSNIRKEGFFEELDPSLCKESPALQLRKTKYTYMKNDKAYLKHAFSSWESGDKKCKVHDEHAVIYMSSFSINHNFSHFLHSLLRLFCALLDARFIVWNNESQSFDARVKYVIWMDENVKLGKNEMEWMRMMGGTLRHLRDYKQGDCFSSNQLVYGSGCAKLLPPEKWYGYPGCRANKVLPAFAHFIRAQTEANMELQTVYAPIPPDRRHTDKNLNIVFSVRKVGALTGMRRISNLGRVQRITRRALRVEDASIKNISFEDLTPRQAVQRMSTVHVFVSVHGAGMTNTFFMHPKSAIVEIIPYPLCTCRSRDYFYGISGYYHGSSIAQGIRHYVYCVPAYYTQFQVKPADNSPNVKCNWKQLHAVASVKIEEHQFASMLKGVERELVASGVIEVHDSIISLNPNVNG